MPLLSAPAFSLTTLRDSYAYCQLIAIVLIFSQPPLRFSFRYHYFSRFTEPKASLITDAFHISAVFQPLAIALGH